ANVGNVVRRRPGKVAKHCSFFDSVLRDLAFERAGGGPCQLQCCFSVPAGGSAATVFRATGKWRSGNRAGIFPRRVLSDSSDVRTTVGANIGGALWGAGLGAKFFLHANTRRSD